jgi:hypothetical protein
MPELRRHHGAQRQLLQMPELRRDERLFLSWMTSRSLEAMLTTPA